MFKCAFDIVGFKASNLLQSLIFSPRFECRKPFLKYFKSNTGSVDQCIFCFETLKNLAIKSDILLSQFFPETRSSATQDATQRKKSSCQSEINCNQHTNIDERHREVACQC